MLQAGEAIPAATVFRGPGDAVDVRALGDGRPFLLVFYLFDWSST
jgi:hypothetical protein